MWKLNLIFVAAIVITILLTRHETKRYADARLAGQVTSFERQRFVRRMSGTGVLTIVLAMTYFGYTYKELFTNRPAFFSLYWAGCILLVASLIVLAVLDARAVFKQSFKTYLSEGSEAERLEKFIAQYKEKADKQP